jgi:hypothetical protein
MAQLTCPKCGVLAERGDYGCMTWLGVILLFPIGLLFLLGGRQPTKCPECGFTWQA